jgi:hypothetical protein
MCGGHPRQRGDLGCVAVRAGRVDQAGREPPDTLRGRLGKEFPHPLQLGKRRRALLSAHDGEAQRRVPHLQREVHGGPRGVDGIGVAGRVGPVPGELGLQERRRGPQLGEIAHRER